MLAIASHSSADGVDALGCFVVDDAIVMLENIVRYREMGKPRMEAALLASKEIGFTIVSMTISLVAVFVPVLFMGGIVGRLLHEFAVTITVAILISGFVSLTLTPMLGSRFLRFEPAERHGVVYDAFERGFNGITHALRSFNCSASCVTTFITVLFATAMLGGTVYLFMTMPTGFIPSQDTGFIQGASLASQDISFESHGQTSARRCRHSGTRSNVERIGAFAGDSNQGFLFAMMKPRPERKLNVDQVMMELRGSLSAVPA